jgi:hypothetical protein
MATTEMLMLLATTMLMLPTAAKATTMLMLPTAAKATTRDADAVDADAAENGEGDDDADAAALDADAAETVKATTMLMLLTTANATTEKKRRMKWNVDKLMLTVDGRKQILCQVSGTGEKCASVSSQQKQSLLSLRFLKSKHRVH